MPGKSKQTTLKTIRVDNDLLAAINSRLSRQVLWLESFNSYVNRVLRNEVMRKHYQKKRK